MNVVSTEELKLSLRVFLVIVCLSFLCLVSQTSYSQSEQQDFTAPKFGLTMQYPPDWTFIPEEEEFVTETYGRSYGLAVLGDFCPTYIVGDDPVVLECQDKSPAFLKVTVHNLRNGTTVDQFYDQYKSKFDAMNDLSPTKILDKNEIEVSGHPAIELTRVAVGGGSLEKLFGQTGQDTTKGKTMLVFTVSGNRGYYIFASVDDQKNFDMYLPIFKDMIDSIQIK